VKFIPFRLKILGAFVALIGAGLAVSLSIVQRTQTRQVNAEIRQRLEAARMVFEADLASRERQLSTAVRLLGGDFAFKQTLASTQDPGTIDSAALNFQSRIGADVMWVTDASGMVLADTSRTMKPGGSMKGVSVVAGAMDGAAGASIQLIGGKPYQLAAAPIMAPDPIAVLTAGFRVDDELAAHIKKLSLAEVSFATKGDLFASTLPTEERRRLLQKQTQLGPGGISIIGGRGRRQIVLPDKVSEQVTAYLQFGYDDALEALHRQMVLLAVTGLAAFAFSVLIGYAIADGVTRPVKRLVDATRKLVDGDYGVRVDARQRDELGQLGSAFNSMVEGLQEKEKIRSVLQKTVSKEIADELLKRGQINLGGEERSVTVLFSDIRGFTTISEGLEPPKLVEQLNAYFKRMDQAILAGHGVIDKFVGDAIMALFGAPVAGPDDAANALRAALGMIAALDSLNAERAAAGLPAWKNGIGVNTGHVVAGTMGSEDRWSYTVIGDSVNLASRLEGLTKHYGARVLVSRATKEAAKGAFVYRTLDMVRVKGKSEPVEVFELLGEGTAAPAWLAPFEAGVGAYRLKRFSEAREAFGSSLKLRPDDLAVKLYLERLAKLSTVPDSWEPAVTMHEK
jgi:adenylate cyclase